MEKSTVPTSRGVFIGSESTSASGIDICADTWQCIDFTTTNTEFKGRIIYTTTTNDFRMHVNASGTAPFVLNSTYLVVNGTTLQSSDKRLKYNNKPLTNALAVNSQLEPVEYDQAQDLVDMYRPDTPQSHQCGFIAQAVQQIDQLAYAVVGGEFGEDGKKQYDH